MMMMESYWNILKSGLRFFGLFQGSSSRMKGPSSFGFVLCTQEGRSQFRQTRQHKWNVHCCDIGTFLMDETQSHRAIKITAPTLALSTFNEIIWNSDRKIHTSQETQMIFHTLHSVGLHWLSISASAERRKLLEYAEDWLNLALVWKKPVLCTWYCYYCCRAMASNRLRIIVLKGLAATSQLHDVEVDRESIVFELMLIIHRDHKLTWRRQRILCNGQPVDECDRWSQLTQEDTIEVQLLHIDHRHVKPISDRVKMMDHGSMQRRGLRVCVRRAERRQGAGTHRSSLFWQGTGVCQQSFKKRSRFSRFGDGHTPLDLCSFRKDP